MTSPPPAKRTRHTKPRVHVGTSGWTYDDWSGAFYPEGVRGADRLDYYRTRFDTVEVNATFYRLPTEAMLNSWNNKLSRQFHLVLKGSRAITHRKKLAGCEDALAAFWERARRLKALQVLLWQLPPGLKKDLSRLETFLRLLPRGVRHAFEFRHESWWDQKVEALLKRHRAAFVAVSHPELPEDIRPTTDFLYLRFHGKGKTLYQYDYSNAELRAWAARVHQALPGRRLYAFFNNDWDARAPKNAATFRKLLG